MVRVANQLKHPGGEESTQARKLMNLMGGGGQKNGARTG